jgi:hypothetical protein
MGDGYGLDGAPVVVPVPVAGIWMLPVLQMCVRPGVVWVHESVFSSQKSAVHPSLSAQGLAAWVHCPVAGVQPSMVQNMPVVAVQVRPSLQVPPPQISVPSQRSASGQGSVLFEWTHDVFTQVSVVQGLSSLH